MVRLVFETLSEKELHRRLLIHGIIGRRISAQEAGMIWPSACELLFLPGS